MDPLELHALAQTTFLQAVVRMGDGRFTSPTCCPGWDVRALVEHVVDGNRRVQIRGGRSPLPGEPPAADATTTVLAGLLLLSGGAAHDVFAAPGGISRSYALSVGEMPGALFLDLRCLDLLVHAWDLGDAIGRPVDVADDVARAALATARRAVTDDLRRPGLFAAARPCAATRPLLDQIAAHLGRSVERGEIGDG